MEARECEIIDMEVDNSGPFFMPKPFDLNSSFDSNKECPVRKRRIRKKSRIDSIKDSKIRKIDFLTKSKSTQDTISDAQMPVFSKQYSLRFREENKELE